MNNYTTDDFLGGKISLIQDKNGLRATSDSVFLSALIRPKNNDTILDVGCGNGVIALCLKARTPQVKLTGIDIQPGLINLARQNATRNQMPLDLYQMDITHRPSPIHGKQFHHVITNPPFYNEPYARSNSQSAIAYQQTVGLKEWLLFCLRHIRAKGTLNLIHRTEALPEILSILSGKIGAIDVIPLSSKENEPACRILIHAQLDSKRALKLYPPLIVHQENGKFTKIAEQILRNGLSIYDIIS